MVISDLDKEEIVKDYRLRFKSPENICKRYGIDGNALRSIVGENVGQITGGSLTPYWQRRLAPIKNHNKVTYDDDGITWLDF